MALRIILAAMHAFLCCYIQGRRSWGGGGGAEGAPAPPIFDIHYYPNPVKPPNRTTQDQPFPLDTNVTTDVHLGHSKVSRLI